MTLRKHWGEPWSSSIKDLCVRPSVPGAGYFCYQLHFRNGNQNYYTWRIIPQSKRTTISHSLIPSDLYHRDPFPGAPSPSICFWQHSWRSRSLVRFFGGDVEMQCYSHQSKKHGKFDMPTNGNQSKKHVKYRNLLTKPSPWQNRCNPSFFTCIWALVNLTHLWLQDHHDIIYAHELYIQTFQTH